MIRPGLSVLRFLYLYPDLLFKLSLLLCTLCSFCVMLMQTLNFKVPRLAGIPRFQVDLRCQATYVPPAAALSQLDK